MALPGRGGILAAAEGLSTAADDRQPPGAVGAADGARSCPGGAQPLPAPGARPHQPADRRDSRHAERADRAATRAAWLRCRQEDQRSQAGAAGRYGGPDPRAEGSNGVGSGPRRGSGARARTRERLAAQGLGRPRPQRRGSRNPDDAPRHRPRAGRAPEQEGLRGRASAIEGRADLCLPAALSPSSGRSRRQDREVAHHDPAGLAVHDQRTLRAPGQATRVPGPAPRPGNGTILSHHISKAGRRRK